MRVVLFQGGGYVAIIDRFLARSIEGFEVTILVHVPSLGPDWNASAYEQQDLRTLITSDGRLVREFGCGCFGVENGEAPLLFVCRCSFQ